VDFFVAPAWATSAIQLLGLPGLIFVIWHFDNKRLEKKEELRRAEVEAVLKQYREDVAAIRRMYESNVRLVEDYETMNHRLEAVYNETMSVISLNTQTLTRLVETVRGNMFCPLVREKGGIPA